LSQKQNEVRAFYEMLKILLANPCLIIMLGDWRTGKTDTSLLIAHLAKKWKLVDRIGSNIWTYNNPLVEYVTSMGSLRRFLYQDRSIKLFPFDEALTHLPRRRAMSKKSVDVVSLIPELSKAHGRMIFIAQTEKIDSELWDTAFLRATMRKESKTVLTVKSTLFESVSFTGVPRSPIRFDKDRLAEFSVSENVGFDSLSLEVKCASLYAGGTSLSTIAKDLALHRELVKRNIRKVLKAFIEREQIQVVETPKPAQSETGLESEAD